MNLLVEISTLSV